MASRTYQKGRSYRGSGGTGGLTARQKGALSATAAKAYREQDGLGLTDDLSLDDWRRCEAVRVCGRRISQATQRDYLRLQAHFRLLAGEKKRAAQAIVKGASRDPETKPRETNEVAGNFRHHIAEALANHRREMLARDEPEERIIGWPYLHGICRAKFHAKAYPSLEAAEAEQLYYTIRNRIAAREGRGDNDNRNKKQRRKKP